MDDPSGRRPLAENVSSAANLDAVLLDRVEAAYESVASKAVEAVREHPPGTDIGVHFEAALRAVLEAAAADPDLTRLCLVEAPGLGAKAVEAKERGLQRFVDLLDRQLAAARGGAAPPLVAEMVVGGIYEVVQRAARTGDIARLPDLADQLGALWLPALRER
jgi:hypothetical protein